MSLPAIIEARLAQLGMTWADLARKLAAPVWDCENPRDIEGRLSKWRKFHAGEATRGDITTGDFAKMLDMIGLTMGLDAAPAPKMWYVEFERAAVAGERKRRVFRFFALAASGDDAINKTREREGFEAAGIWRADEAVGDVESIGLVIR